MTETTERDDLSKEVHALRSEMAKLNNHSFIKLHDNLWKLGLFQLYRGLAFGLGSVMGATILVSVAAYVLAQIDFIPIIGDWAVEIAKEIDGDNASSYGVPEETGDAPASADNIDDASAAESNPSPGAGEPDATDLGINTPADAQ